MSRGLQTQKEKGINIGDPNKQRLKSLKYHGIVINGIRYSIDDEQRTYLCETTRDYYIEKMPKCLEKKRKKNI